VSTVIDFATRAQRVPSITEAQADTFTDAADAEALADLQVQLRGVFRDAVRRLTEKPTPCVPVAFSYEAGGDDAPHQRHIVRSVPITAYLGDHFDRLWAALQSFELLSVDAARLLDRRDLIVASLTTQYVQDNAAGLLAAHWSRK